MIGGEREREVREGCRQNEERRGGGGWERGRERDAGGEGFKELQFNGNNPT